MKKTITLTFMLILLFASTVGWGQESAESSKKEGKQQQVLLKNIRLDFSIVPADDDDNGVFIITALPKYKTGASFEGRDGSFEFHVSGTVSSHGNGKILVVYEAFMIYEGEEEGGKIHAEFNASSGVLLEPGKELEVSKFGDKTLVISAEYVD